MTEFLILRLQGVFQAWGGHTFEDYRPSEAFPTRSGLVGLLGACLGIDRRDTKGLSELSQSFRYAARADGKDWNIRKITDYHTVLEPRLVPGSTRGGAVVSQREYLCDAQFTTGVEFYSNSEFDLQTVHQAVCYPVYTPSLGRRSCPLGQPLFHSILHAADLHSALAMVPPGKGVIYSELQGNSPNRYTIRDVPMEGNRRQFSSRTVYIHVEGGL